MENKALITIALIFTLLGGLLVHWYDDTQYQAALEIMAQQAYELGECERINEGLSEQYSKLLSRQAFLKEGS